MEGLTGLQIQKTIEVLVSHFANDKYCQLCINLLIGVEENGIRTQIKQFRHT